MKKRLIFAVVFSIILVFSACGKVSETAKLESEPVLKNEKTGIDYVAIVKDIMSTIYNVDMDNLTSEQKDENNVDEYISVDYDMNYYWRRDVDGKLEGFNIYYKGDKFQLVFCEKEDDLNTLISIWKHWESDAGNSVDIYSAYPYGTVLSTKYNDKILEVINKYIKISS